MNALSDFFKSQQDREDLKKIERLRRQGEKFIKVRYNGNTVPQIDSEGVCYNIRFHGLRDTEAYEQTDTNTGKTDWHARPGARVLQLRQSAAGDIEGNIWDDPDDWNKHFLSTHPELEVLDSSIKEEIEKVKKQPFKTEYTRKEELERDIAAKLKELEMLDEEQKSAKPSKKKNNVPRKKQEQGEAINGINDATPGVDNSGVSRVEPGRDGEGGSSSI